MEGEPISPEEITEEAGWLTSHRRRGARAIANMNLTPRGQDAGSARSTNQRPRAQQQLRRQRRTPRQPHLPKEDIKIVLRPREGLDVTKMSLAGLRDGVLSATGLACEEAEEDVLRIHTTKNIIVASTPSMERAEK